MSANPTIAGLCASHDRLRPQIAPMASNETTNNSHRRNARRYKKLGVRVMNMQAPMIACYRAQNEHTISHPMTGTCQQEDRDRSNDIDYSSTDSDHYAASGCFCQVH